MSQSGAFRGIQGIREIRARLQPLAKWTKQFKPEQRTLTVKREDFDLIVRWPKAANAEEFVISQNGVYFDGLQLNYAAGPGRYETRLKSTQEGFVNLGIAAEQVRTDIANHIRDRADEALDAARVHNSKTLDEFLAQK